MIWVLLTVIRFALLYYDCVVFFGLFVLRLIDFVFARF